MARAHAKKISEYLSLVTLDEVFKQRDFGHGTSLPVATAAYLDMTRER